MREFGHQNAARVRVLAEARFDFTHRVGVSRERNAQCRSGTLTGVIVGRGADAAERKNNIGRRKGTPQHLRDALPVIADVLGPGQFQAAHPEGFDGPGEVLVLALAGEDFITDDDCPNRWHRILPQ